MPILKYNAPVMCVLLSMTFHVNVCVCVSVSAQLTFKRIEKEVEKEEHTSKKLSFLFLFLLCGEHLFSTILYTQGEKNNSKQL